MIEIPIIGQRCPVHRFEIVLPALLMLGDGTEILVIATIKFPPSGAIAAIYVER